MTPKSIRRALLNAPYGSSALLDAVEAACEAGGDLLRVCDQRLAVLAAMFSDRGKGEDAAWMAECERHREEDRDHWPPEGWPADGVGRYGGTRCESPAPTKTDEEFRSRNLREWTKTVVPDRGQTLMFPDTAQAT